MFERERHPVTISHKGKEHRLFARELGYIHMQELSTTKYPDMQGLRVVASIVAACIEDKDGKAVFTAETLRDLPSAVLEPLIEAAMKAQGLNVDGSTKGEDAPEEADEGNG